MTKRFGPVMAVDAVSLEIRRNEFLALLGPSGCGKTTLLRMLAGFEMPDDGAIAIDGQDMTAVAPNHRPVNMVFQSYAVFPHMSVFDNVAYGLRVTKTDRADIGARVREALEMTQLADLADRRPDQLSGGQRQRVALARALVKRPKVLLLDEPLSALDAKLREAMQLELVRLRHSVGITFVIVTHDQNEALSMADRIAVMDSGRVRQVAPPAELYEYPRSRFVADFIGKINVFNGRVAARSEKKIVLDVENLGSWAVPHDGQPDTSAAGVGADVGVAIRPEKIRLHADEAAAGAVAFAGRVGAVAYYGDTSHVYLMLDAGPTISANVQNDARAARPPFAEGDRVWCSWDPGDTLVLVQ